MAASKRFKGAKRDPGGFVAIPWVVLDSPAYQTLSHAGRALLMEVARQFHGNDNGRMLLSRAYLLTRGWRSADVIQRAKRELLDAGFIFETVMGQRPNKASWYAVTWMQLDKLDGYDPGHAAAFVRGAYLGQRQRPQITCLIPSPGTGGASIAPSGGTVAPLSVPSHGAIRAVSAASPVPSDGNPLEMPSPGASSLRPVKGEKARKSA
jgi:hypothetical protein